MESWLVIALVVGAVAPLVIAVAIVQARIRSLPRREQPEAQEESSRFGKGVAGGVFLALAVSAVVIALVLGIRALVR